MYMPPASASWRSSGLAFLTPEERYDYAVSQLNSGYFEEASDQFKSILADYPQADYAYYGLAVLDSITGRSQDCLDNLARAIELNPKNRLQAAPTTTFRAWWMTPGLRSCCILKFRRSFV